ncbi:Shr3 amino acid permease chaperone [Pisolithus albus]|nr:Shr3 amino acid permease chaperone [Pisolithus albus]
MGVRASIVVCTTSFLLGGSSMPPGSLFTHWIADSLTLWKSPVTDGYLWTGASYYSILTKAPIEPLYVPFAVVVLGGTTIFWSFREGEAGNLMFDGGILYGTTVLMYLHSVIPNVVAKFSSLPHYQINEPFPRVLPSPTLDLASNHLICSVALTGILILQAGRWWAELSDRDDDPTFLQEKSEGPSTPAEEPISQPPLHAPIPTL